MGWFFGVLFACLGLLSLIGSCSSDVLALEPAASATEGATLAKPLRTGRHEWRGSSQQPFMSCESLAL